MDSLAFARDPKPTSPHIKSEDVSWPADNASPSSWLANIKTKIYEIFSMFYRYAPLHATDAIVDRGIGYYYLYVTVPVEISARNSRKKWRHHAWLSQYSDAGGSSRHQQD